MTTKRLVLLVRNDDGTVNSSTSISGLSFETFPSPRGGVPVLFCLQESKQRVLELQTVQPRRNGCWLLDQRVCSDQFMYLATEYDARFLLLPFLEKKDKFSPMDQIVTQSPGCSRFPLHWISKWHMEEICDINDSFGPDMLLYRLNQDKVMSWLRYKVDTTSSVLAAKRFEKESTRNRMKVEGFSASTSESRSIIESNACENIPNGGADITTSTSTKPSISSADIKLAVHIVCDYISMSLGTKLATSYDLDIESVFKVTTAKRKTDWEEQLALENDRAAGISHTGGQSIKDLKKPKTQASLAKKSSSKKVAPLRGMQGIASFFGKK